MGSSEFKAIWLPLESDFYRVAFYILEDAADAADAVQDLYIRLWTSRDSLGGIRQPKAYGLTMLKNICLDRLRHAKVARAESLETAAARIGEPDSAAAARETIKAVERAMESLPESQRRVLEMRAFDDMEYSDIAAATGLTEGSLRVLLSAARKTLRTIIGNERY